MATMTKDRFRDSLLLKAGFRPFQSRGTVSWTTTARLGLTFILRQDGTWEQVQDGQLIKSGADIRSLQRAIAVY